MDITPSASCSITARVEIRNRPGMLGKIGIQNKVPVKTRDDLSMAYMPGVARVCLAIKEDREKVFALTIKQNAVAVVTDGTAVLGLGDIGPEAALPVMEGKTLLFKEFANVDAFPICLATKDVDRIVETVKLIAPVFGGVNLEDISAPRCFEVEERLQRELDIPVFHDDQHGTAVVVLASGRTRARSGSSSAAWGRRARPRSGSCARSGWAGSLPWTSTGSWPPAGRRSWIRSRPGWPVRVMATGRSDYPNQINNVLCFPGFFRGLLDCRAGRVTDEMKIAAARAIASIVGRNELHEEYIIPSVFNKRVAPAVAHEVIRAAQKGGVARRRHRPASPQREGA